MEMSAKRFTAVDPLSLRDNFGSLSVHCQLCLRFRPARQSRQIYANEFAEPAKKIVKRRQRQWRPLWPTQSSCDDYEVLRAAMKKSFASFGVVEITGANEIRNF